METLDTIRMTDLEQANDGRQPESCRQNPGRENLQPPTDFLLRSINRTTEMTVNLPAVAQDDAPQPGSSRLDPGSEDGQLTTD